jgi:hypothetical protein
MLRLCLFTLTLLLPLAHPLGAADKATPADEPTCGSHGTTIDFVDSPTEAAKLAKKETKLVFILHVSGNFEDPRFT